MNLSVHLIARSGDAVTVEDMAWVSHGEAVRLFKIGKATLRSRVQDGSLNEDTREAANGETERLVETEQLDALGYKRRAPRPGDDRPFIEEQLGQIECDLAQAIHINASALARLEAIDVKVNSIELRVSELQSALAALIASPKAPPRFWARLWTFWR